ncbi:MAG: hypothetical protein AAF752_10545 [Bacteroidota bacterium]
MASTYSDFRSALATVFARMEQRVRYAPDVLLARATAALGKAAPLGTGEAAACVGLIAEHTIFFDGFSAFLGTPFASGACAGEGLGRVLYDGPAREPVRVVLDALCRSSGLGVDLAVHSAIPTGLSTTAVLTAAAAGSRALMSAGVDWPEEDLPDIIAEAIGVAYDVPVGIDHVVATLAGRPNAILLADAHTRSRRVFEYAEGEIAWGLVVTDATSQVPDQFYENRRAQYDALMAHLRTSAFPDLESLRDLEHRQMQSAGDALPAPLQPVLRFLGRENQRVQRFGAAARAQNWHLAGGLLVMGQSATEADWGGASVLAPYFELGRGAEDLYGARVVDGAFGTAMLVMGLPMAVAAFLDRSEQLHERHTGAPAQTYLF